MSNCSYELGTLVPIDFTSVVVPLARPEYVVVQTLPSLATVLVWMSIELMRKPRTQPRAVRMFATVSALAAACVSALPLWRVFEVLDCEGYVTGLTWRILAIVGTLILGCFVCIPLARRAPRLAILASLTAAAAAVVCDVGLRGWWVTSHAAIPLVPIQQLWGTVTVMLVLLLPGRRRATIHTATQYTGGPGVVDSLTRREPQCPPSDRTWPWFW